MKFCLKFIVTYWVLNGLHGIAVAEDIDVYLMYHKVRDCHYPALQEEVGKVQEHYLLKKQHESKDVAFIADSEDGPGRERLFRWWNRSTQRTYSGFKPPRPSKFIDPVIVFKAYVWKDKEPGLVPVYCSVAPDGTDPYFTTDEKKHEQKIEEDKKLRRLRRKNLRVLFYAKPPESTADPQ